MQHCFIIHGAFADSERFHEVAAATSQFFMKIKRLLLRNLQAFTALIRPSYIKSALPYTLLF